MFIKSVKRLMWAFGIVLIAYMVSSVVRTELYTSAAQKAYMSLPMRHLELLIECLLLYVPFLIAFRFIGRLIPDEPIPAALRVLRVLGVLGIAVLGCRWGMIHVMLYNSDKSLGGIISTFAGSLPQFIASILHILVYIFGWLLITEWFRYFFSKNKELPLKKSVKLLTWAVALVLPVFIFFRCMSIDLYLKNHLSSAPTWLSYVGVIVEAFLIIFALLAFIAYGRKIPDRAMHPALTALRVVGVIVIIGIGIWSGSHWLAGASSDLLFNPPEVPKLPFILSSVFHTLTYIGLWLLVTECFRAFSKKSKPA